MVIGVPTETHRHEHRVGLTPFAVARLLKSGHTVILEQGAGEDARFTGRNFQEAGGQIVYSREEVYKRADLVCRVGAVPAEELDLLNPGSILCGFQHLAVATRESVERLCELGMTLIGYEIIQDEQEELPVLYPISEMTGQMAVQIAAHYSQNEAGGRGILLGNVPGVPPPTILILGAGTVGASAARQAVARGTHVIVMDGNLKKLSALSHELSGRAVTVLAAAERLRQYTPIADVLIGAILIPGARAPYLVTEAMVHAMKPGSVIIDVSIDQGGCVETSRPTTLADPVFTAHGVVHYCVPNMTANLARTASRALANASIPYICALAEKGLDSALKEDPGLAAGVYLYKGHMVHGQVGEVHGMKAEPLALLLGGRGAR